jgi:hypothetical protein
LLVRILIINLFFFDKRRQAIIVFVLVLPLSSKAISFYGDNSSVIKLGRAAGGRYNSKLIQ